MSCKYFSLFSSPSRRGGGGGGGGGGGEGGGEGGERSGLPFFSEPGRKEKLGEGGEEKVGGENGRRNILSKKR